MSKKLAKTRSRQLSPQVRRALLGAGACVLAVAGGWWAYFTFTTIAPPPVEQATAPEVVAFLGNPRGFSRMSYDQREQFLTQVFSGKFASGPPRAELNEALRQMPSSEREVLMDATVEVAKVRFMEHARKYKSLPRTQQAAYVDNAVRHFSQMQMQLAGTGGADNFGESFKDLAPSTSDEITKAIVSRTSARERAEAQQFVDALAARYKELSAKH